MQLLCVFKYRRRESSAQNSQWLLWIALPPQLTSVHYNLELPPNAASIDTIMYCFDFDRKRSLKVITKHIYLTTRYNLTYTLLRVTPKHIYLTTRYTETHIPYYALQSAILNIEYDTYKTLLFDPRYPQGPSLRVLSCLQNSLVAIQVPSGYFQACKSLLFWV